MKSKMKGGVGSNVYAILMCVGYAIHSAIPYIRESDGIEGANHIQSSVGLSRKVDVE